MERKRKQEDGREEGRWTRRKEVDGRKEMYNVAGKGEINGRGMTRERHEGRKGMSVKKEGG